MISIIIATYNRAAYIGETLSSIINQTYTDFECIIIDDGSTDNTSDIVAAITKEDSRFTYIIRPETVKKGANHSRNYGYSLSKGNYVKFFDSDDVMLPTHLETSINILKKGNYDFVVADCVNFDNTGLLKRPYEIDRRNSTLDAIHYAQFKTAWITNDLLVKREYANQLEFAGDIKDQASEFQYNVRLLLLTQNGFLINEILTHRRIHDGSFFLQSQKHQMRFDIMNADNYYATVQYIKDIAPTSLIKYLISSHVLLTFNIARKRKWPEHILGATLLLVKSNGLKGFFYPAAVIFGFVTGKGYKIAKYVRD
ncbi:glycosyltransferase involved in cell wall biosynthesis [Dokdonia sp. Hel_I_63]|jgi:glycosyltransferase involved in cell wall biosynthesis|uniref:glycosyltransferase family 2 protein n=1 Tax=unclassified Dokdonia TaxID=2615033 RepID=UPI00020A64B4|nr:MULTISPECIES: glycosyltransferase family 2 protein [unclassified Dokdonia]AEE20035.1 glycosyl transferase family 2 [Dokdonia sp. 4H-3-7-5]TVZ23711.1 glycosyltransferase involved in cell wall biosynthesis [Dokdonia sp. Hel_I_63]